MITKSDFGDVLVKFVSTLSDYVSTDAGQWTIKGFIDTYKEIYTISSDTKVVSKILEIHLFPRILAFAEDLGFEIVLADHQNYYPDLTFVSKADETIRFAVDFKTTYRNPRRPWLCNGFTLGSHGTYFSDRSSTKNLRAGGSFRMSPTQDTSAWASSTIVRTPVRSMRHGICTIDLRAPLNNLRHYQHSVFVVEKWRIASDKRGSGNTANIGSIRRIADIVSGNGMFAKLGEEWFDDYWMNYGRITVRTESGGTKRITSLEEFVAYRGGDTSLIVPRSSSQ